MRWNSCLLIVLLFLVAGCHRDEPVETPASVEQGPSSQAVGEDGGVGDADPDLAEADPHAIMDAALPTSCFPAEAHRVISPCPAPVTEDLANAEGDDAGPRRAAQAASYRRQAEAAEAQSSWEQCADLYDRAAQLIADGRPRREMAAAAVRCAHRLLVEGAPAAAAGAEAGARRDFTATEHLALRAMNRFLCMEQRGDDALRTMDSRATLYLRAGHHAEAALLAREYCRVDPDSERGFTAALRFLSSVEALSQVEGPAQQLCVGLLRGSARELNEHYCEGQEREPGCEEIRRLSP